MNKNFTIKDAIEYHKYFEKKYKKDSKNFKKYPDDKEACLYSSKCHKKMKKWFKELLIFKNIRL